MRRVIAFLTHWQRGPHRTQPYAPHRSPPRARLAVVGDVGERRRGVRDIAAAIASLGSERPYDALLLLGDNVYPSGDPARLQETVFDPFAAVLAQGTDLLAVLGNHDVRAGHGPGQLAAIGMPGRWWSRTYPGVVVTGLDSTDPEDPAQRRFLAERLADAGPAWRIVAFHHPPYSAGWYGSDRRVRRAFGPLLVEHGADIVLSGHEHDYQRSRPIDGVTYVVSGATAKCRRTNIAPFTATALGWRHFVDITVLDDGLVLRAVNRDLRVGDELVLARAMR